MKIESFNENVEYNEDRVSTRLILESSFSKEIRIQLKKGQVMKEHKAPFSIIVHVLEGEIDFGLNGEVNNLVKGSMVSIEANVQHELSARADSIIRLTLSKMDKAERVENVAIK